jgi:hypothetical protein
MIDLYQNEFNLALKLAEECIKRGDIIDANLHLEEAIHDRITFLIYWYSYPGGVVPIKIA